MSKFRIQAEFNSEFSILPAKLKHKQKERDKFGQVNEVRSFLECWGREANDSAMFQVSFAHLFCFYFFVCFCFT